MTEIQTTEDVGTGSDREPPDPAARLQELLGTVHSVVGQLTQEREQAKTQEGDLRRWLAAAQERAHDLDRQLNDAHQQITELGEQLSRAREQDADSTRQL